MNDDAPRTTTAGAYCPPLSRDDTVGSSALSAPSMVGERRSGCRLTHKGADLRWSLGAELWVCVRLTRITQPFSSDERLQIIVDKQANHSGLKMYFCGEKINSNEFYQAIGANDEKNNEFVKASCNMQLSGGAECGYKTPSSLHTYF